MISVSTVEVFSSNYLLNLFSILVCSLGEKEEIEKCIY